MVCAVVTITMFGHLVTGDPGRRDRRVVGKSAIEELQKNLETFSGETSIQRICFTCWEWKGLRTKHCSVCDVCVDGFDHHCGWLNNCVAEKNHREFVIMVLSVFIGMVAFLSVTVTGFINSNSTLYTVLWEKPLLWPSWIVHVGIVPWLGILVFHQMRTIALNLNTNEMINMHRYSHFWEGPVKAEVVSECHDDHGHNLGHGKRCGHKHGSGRQFKNPFDQGGVVNNCKYFWFRKHRYQPVGVDEIELAEV